MNKIALIYPYFGALPDIFFYWLKSVSYNAFIDVYIFTDRKIDCALPSNVTVRYMTFSEMQDLVGRHFDFAIGLDRPYKICDFRPAFGEIFFDVLQGYDFWGYGDVDVVWGDMHSFLTDDILNQYERISQYGHFSIYRNNDKLRQLYKTSYQGKEVYKTVFSNTDGYTFDEFWKEYGIEQIATEQGIKELRDFRFAGVERIYKKRRMCFDFEIDGNSIPEKEHNVFLWRKGKLYLYRLNKDKTVSQEEFAYAHFQKRNIVFPMAEEWMHSDIQEYWIVPNKVIIGNIQEVFDYFDSEEYEREKRTEQIKFIEFRQKYPDVY